MLDYQTAIAATEHTINRRATLFRRQAIAVLVLVVGTVMYAIAEQRLDALVLLLAVIPVCGVFFLLDAITLRDWRLHLLSAWTEGEIDFVAFFPAVRANPILPQQTLEGMLATLPDAGDLTYEQTLERLTRRAIAAASIGIRQDEFSALLSKVIASAAAAGFAIAGVWMQQWWPLMTVVLLLILPVAHELLRRRRRVHRDHGVTRSSQEAGFNSVDFQRMMGILR